MSGTCHEKHGCAMWGSKVRHTGPDDLVAEIRTQEATNETKKKKKKFHFTKKKTEDNW